MSDVNSFVIIGPAQDLPAAFRAVGAVGASRRTAQARINRRPSLSDSNVVFPAHVPRVWESFVSTRETVGM